MVAALLQPLSGDLSAKKVARHQPLKLAAIENLEHTQTGAPLLGVPKMLSFLAFSDFEAEVQGWSDFPPENRPPIAIVHGAFIIMVGLGSGLLIFSLVLIFIRRRDAQFFQRRKLLKLLVFCTPLGFIALEAGWVVTEVGRQPWIIYGVMKTKDAVTDVPGIVLSLIVTILLYSTLSVAVFCLIRRQIRHLEES